MGCCVEKLGCCTCATDSFEGISCVVLMLSVNLLFVFFVNVLFPVTEHASFSTLTSSQSSILSTSVQDLYTSNNVCREEASALSSAYFPVE